MSVAICPLKNKQVETSRNVKLTWVLLYTVPVSSELADPDSPGAKKRFQMFNSSHLIFDYSTHFQSLNSNNSLISKLFQSTAEITRS